MKWQKGDLTISIVVAIAVFILIFVFESRDEKQDKSTSFPPTPSISENTEVVDSQLDGGSASEAFEQSDADEEVAEGYLAQGREQFFLGEYEAALENYNQAIQLAPSSAEAYTYRAELYEQIQQYDLAMSDCLHALQLNSAYAFAYLVQGMIYQDTDRYEAAAKAYKQAIKSDENLEQAYLQLVQLDIDQQKYFAGYDLMNLFLARFSENASGYVWRGVTKWKLGAIRTSEQDLRYAIQLDPNNYESHYWLGKNLLDQDRFDDALGELTQALEINPEYSIAYRDRAMIYAHLGIVSESLLDRENVGKYNLSIVNVPAENYDLEILRVWQTNSASGEYPDGIYLIFESNFYNYSPKEVCITKKDFAAQLDVDGDFVEPSSDNMEPVRDEFYPGIDYPGNTKVCVAPYTSVPTLLVFITAPDITILNMAFKPNDEDVRFQLWLSSEKKQEYSFVLAELDGTQMFEFKAITFTDTVKNVHLVETAKAWNCPYGIHVDSRTLTQSVEREISVDKYVELNSFVMGSPILNTVFRKLFLEARIELEYGSWNREATTDIISFSSGQIFEAQPGTVTRTDIVWVVISRQGIIEFSVKGRPFSLPFSIDEQIQPEYKTYAPEPCTAMPATDQPETAEVLY